MRRLQVPPRPDGNSAFAHFCQALWDVNFGGWHPFKDTSTIKWKWSPNLRGHEAHVKFPPMPQNPGQKFQLFYPFKIYQPTNLTQWIGQTIPTFINYYGDGDGDGFEFTDCMIVDAQTPTNISADPPQVSVADAWRFIAVRDGLVETRQNYQIEGSQLEFNNNYAYCIAPDNTDGLVADASDITFGGNPFEVQSTITQNPPLVIGVNGLEQTGEAYANLWVAIYPDTSSSTEIYCQLEGYCGVGAFGENGSAGQFYNSGSNTLDVGTVEIGVSGVFSNAGAGGVPFLAINVTFNHFLNRYPVGNGNGVAGSGMSGVMNFRGISDNGVEYPGVSQGTLPEDLAQQCFFPGDVISYFAVDGSGNIENDGLYMWITSPGFAENVIEGVILPTAGSQWQMIRDIPYQAGFTYAPIPDDGIS